MISGVAQLEKDVESPSSEFEETKSEKAPIELLNLSIRDLKPGPVVEFKN